MITLAIFRAVEHEIGEFPKLLLPWSLLILCKLGSELRAKICPVCCNHNVLYRQFLLKLSQGRKEPLWSVCVMRLREQSLLFLPSQICWEWPWEWRTRQLFSCLWPRGREDDYRGRVGDTHGNGGIFFFHLSPKSLWFWFIRGGNKTACLKGLWNKHTQARFSPALKAVKVVELNW